MPGKRSHRLGELQFRILKVLWDHPKATVAEVLEELDGGLAYTTVATMLRKMEGRGLVRHEEQGRKFLYEAVVSAEDVTRSMADDLVDRLFGGSLARAMSHLLETREVSHQELVRLERLIRERKRRP